MRFYISNLETDEEIDVDPDFAVKLQHKDVMWIREDSEPHEYPWFPKITQEDIDKWADGWYGVVMKNYLPGEVEIRVLEIHDKIGYKKQFYDFDI